MIAKIKLWIYGIAAAIGVFAMAWFYRTGKRNAVQDLMEEDYENAQDIRRRVSVDRADRLREYDGAGWRD